MRQEYYLGIMSGTSLDGVDIAHLLNNRNLSSVNLRRCQRIYDKIYCN